MLLGVEAQFRLQGERTYSHTGSRGLAWYRPTASSRRWGSSDSRNARVSGVIVSRVHVAARAAPRENCSSAIAPVTPRSWLPARQTAAFSRARATHVSGSAP